MDKHLAGLSQEVNENYVSCVAFNLHTLNFVLVHQVHIRNISSDKCESVDTICTSSLFDLSNVLCQVKRFPDQHQFQD